VTLRARWVTLRAWLGDAKSLLGDASGFTERRELHIAGLPRVPTGLAFLPRLASGGELLLSVQVSFLGDAKSLLGDARSSLGDAKSSLGDAKSLG
jgi:hypothetical protein